MERKFGIFEHFEELNRAAAAQKKEGDKEALIALALENGLEKEDAEDYWETEDENWGLCNATMAAMGKLKLEEQELQLKSQMKDWKDFVVQMVLEDETGNLARAVFSPKKELAEVLAAGLKTASSCAMLRRIKRWSCGGRKSRETGMPPLPGSRRRI